MARPKNPVKQVVVDVNSHLGKLTDNIRTALKEYKEAKNDQARVHRRKMLAAAVADTMNFVARGMKEGQFKADPTGLMVGDSSFEDPVNQIAKEWLVKINRANPDSEIGEANRLGLQHAQESGFAKFVAMTSHGVQIVWDGIKGGVLFVYGKIKEFFTWVWDKLKTFWQWIKEKFAGFVGSNKDTKGAEKLKEINMEELLKEGEDSLATNYPKAVKEAAVEVEAQDAKIVKEVKNPDVIELATA